MNRRKGERRFDMESGLEVRGFLSPRGATNFRPICLDKDKQESSKFVQLSQARRGRQTLPPILAASLVRSVGNRQSILTSTHRATPTSPAGRPPQRSDAGSASYAGAAGLTRAVNPSVPVPVPVPL